VVGVVPRAERHPHRPPSARGTYPLCTLAPVGTDEIWVQREPNGNRARWALQYPNYPMWLGQTTSQTANPGEVAYAHCHHWCNRFLGRYLVRPSRRRRTSTSAAGIVRAATAAASRMSPPQSSGVSGLLAMRPRQPNWCVASMPWSTGPSSGRGRATADAAATALRTSSPASI